MNIKKTIYTIDITIYYYIIYTIKKIHCALSLAVVD